MTSRETFTKASKSMSGLREIPICDVLYDILKRRKREYDENKLRLGKEFHDADHVISKTNGEPYSPDGISTRWREFVKNIPEDNFPLLCFHSLRYTFCSLIVANGIDIKTAEDLN